MKKLVLTILAVLGIIILVAAISLSVYVYSFWKSLRPKIDPALYADIVAQRLVNSTRYKFLPETIPQDASKIAFFHIPGFLQGPDVIALRVALPKERIEQIITDLNASGRQEIKSFGQIPAPHAYPGYDMRKPSSKNMYEGVSEIPPDFRIFLY
ncbi:MAG: hypothetical protein A2Y07_09125 [Planctomycetes bacterium GWF2_50_10]|nr:MAG: hypothetical protein A2Y07_09125 [Planctomycetes bacterium GWF2_50_10]